MLILSLSPATIVIVVVMKISVCIYLLLGTIVCSGNNRASASDNYSSARTSHSNSYSSHVDSSASNSGMDVNYTAISGATRQCNTYSKSNRNILSVHFINLDSSHKRKEFMLQHLYWYGLLHNNNGQVSMNGVRIAAHTPDKVYIPASLAIPYQCRSVFIIDRFAYAGNFTDFIDGLKTYNSISKQKIYGSSARSSVNSKVSSSISDRSEATSLACRSIRELVKTFTRPNLNGRQAIPYDISIVKKGIDLEYYKNYYFKAGSNVSDRKDNIFALLLTHCGRLKQTKRELTVTISHLHTIYRSIYENIDTKNSQYKKYALILEDDLQFDFEIDFQSLIDQLPKDFAVVQLITSNYDSVNSLYKIYNSRKKTLIRRYTHDDYWCAGAYLVNKEVMKPYIDKIVIDLSNFLPPSHRNSQLFGYNLLAGHQKQKCFPKYCCSDNIYMKSVVDRSGNSSEGEREASSICIDSPRGYQADNFIFSIVPESSYILTIPVITGAVIGNKSTLHQHHVNYHVKAFHRINEIIEEIKTNIPSDGHSSIPFINPKCKGLNAI